MLAIRWYALFTGFRLITAMLQPSVQAHDSFWFLMALLLVLAATSSVGSLGKSLAIEKEWVKIICGDDSQFLFSWLEHDSVHSFPGLVCDV